MKRKLSNIYLLDSTKNIQSHLKNAKNFREVADRDLKILCFETALNGNVALIKEIIARHPDVILHINDLDDSGNTVLYLAASNGHVEMVRFLLANGADPNLRGEQNKFTILEHICLNIENITTDRTKLNKIIKLLLSKILKEEVNELLDFLSNNLDEYQEGYNLLLPLVQEYRISLCDIEEYTDEELDSTDGIAVQSKAEKTENLYELLGNTGISNNLSSQLSGESSEAEALKINILYSMHSDI